MEKLKELFIRAKQGDDNAFEEIVDRFDPLLCKVAMRAGKFDEDCYQECLIALYVSIQKFNITD
ncbi:helix-turn-helix domain-containing protein [Enterococcus avium]